VAELEIVPVDPELERLLQEEEEIERRTRGDHHETPISRGISAMLMPRKVKHRKQQRGRYGGPVKGGTEITFGDYGIQALDAAGFPPVR